jgi:melanoma-associated antigen
MLSGGQLPDAKFERILRRTGLEDDTPIQGYEKTEKLVKRLEKEGYILKVKEGASNGEEDVFWVLGPRAKIEVGEKGVEGLVKSVYDPQDDEEDEELRRKVARSLGIADGQNRKDSAPKKKGRRRKEDAREDGDEEEEEEDDESEDD